MDRNRLLEHLALAERHIKLAEKHIATQIDVIARLESHGHDTTEAKRLLEEFRELHAIDITTRARVREELALLA